jgi:integrase
MSIAIHLKKVRAKLAERQEPFWAPPLGTNQSLGYRQKGGGSWIARFKESGKYRYKALGPCTETFDFHEAKEEARKWFADLERGVSSDGETVETACRAYVKDRRTEKSEANAHDAMKRFERTVYGTEFGARLLDKLRTAHIKAWRNALIEPGAGKRGLSKASANRTLTSLKAALNLAVKDRRVTASAVIEWKSVEPYENANKRRDLFLDLDARRKLLDAASGAVKDLIEAAMLTGARAGELVNATRQQFDVRTGTLTLKGKTGERSIPLSPPAVKLFKRLAENKLPLAYLLTRDDGKQWNHSDWDELVRDAATRAELPKGCCLYVMRHSYVTTALQSGMSVSDVGHLVGTSAAMIQKHYHHLVDDHVRERLARIVMV